MDLDVIVSESAIKNSRNDTQMYNIWDIIWTLVIDLKFTINSIIPYWHVIL